MVSRDAWRNVIPKHTDPITEEMFYELGYGDLESSNSGEGKFQIPEVTSPRDDSSRTEERVLQVYLSIGESMDRPFQNNLSFEGGVFDISDENFLICYKKALGSYSDGDRLNDFIRRECYHIPWGEIIAIEFQITQREVT